MPDCFERLKRPPQGGDRDGDGVEDSRDRCPGTHGNGSADGCPPDRDGDGVFDREDRCPGRHGQGSSDGCPKVNSGAIGVKCGKARFRWYDITESPEFVRKGEKACVYLLSNATARELLRRAIDAGETLTKTFGKEIVRELAIRYADDATAATIEFEVKRRLKKAGWRWLAQGLPRTLSAFKAINAITLAGKATALTAVPLGKLVVINQIRNKGACVKLEADVDRGKLKLNWNLVYNPNAVKNLRRDRHLTLASVRDHRDDEHPVGLRCNPDGTVGWHTTPSTVFTDAITAVG